MPENHGERDVFDEDQDQDEAEYAWEEAGSPPGGYPLLSSGRSGDDGHPARRGLLIALTALVAAAAGFGVVAVAIHDVSGTPAASAAPGAEAPDTGGSGSDPSSGASMHLEVGGPVTAVSATSITLGSGDRAVTATVTRATTVTGKVTSISGIKVGDLVSASISGTGGKLTASSIQDPASLPSGPGQ